MLFWPYRTNSEKGKKMNNAKQLNRLILTATVLTAGIFGALLAPPVAYAITYLFS